MVRVRLSGRSASLLFGLLVLAVGAARTAGLGSRMPAAVLETQPAAPGPSSLTSRPGPESGSTNGVVIQSAAVPAESRADAGTSSGHGAPPAFVPVAFE